MSVTIIHYHLFKNAGTSVDEILDRNFGSGFRLQEFQGEDAAIACEVERLLNGDRTIKALSSHTAVGPLPMVSGQPVFPIIFLRHPIDRLYSAYNFERDQNVSSFGSIVARSTTFAEYLRIHLDLDPLQVFSNFQSKRLSSFSNASSDDILSSAMDAFASLPFVGVTDYFYPSMLRYRDLLGAHAVELEVFDVHVNAGTISGKSLAERLQLARRELADDELWSRIVKLNSADIELYNTAVQALAAVGNGERAAQQNGRPVESRPTAARRVPAPPVPDTVDRYFDTLESFMQWLSSAVWLSAPALVKKAEAICRSGFMEPLTGRHIAEIPVNPGNSLREGLVYRGVCSRHRAVLHAIEEEVGKRPKSDVRIYAPEAITPFALLLRWVFPRFVGSEYSALEGSEIGMWPIPNEDLTDLSFGSNLFDIVSTNEVLEHVSDLDAALSEIYRVLVPGGVHIGTHPFRFTSNQSEIRARMVNGEVIHLMEPEYHGDPFSKEGCLVFETPGWDIIERCRAQGFSDVKMRLMMSARYGYLSDHAGGIFVLYARK